jgi:DNA-binding transcriptional MerR regulator
MPNPAPIRIPASAVQELERIENSGHHFRMDDLVRMVNDVVRRFVPAAHAGGDQRVSGVFTVRTLRHYQTLGCLAAPEKQGREARYQFHHYLQALVIRKLLHEGLSAERIHPLMQQRGTDELKQLLFSGIEVMAQTKTTAKELPAAPEPWHRLMVAPGVELHLRSMPPKLTPKFRQQLLAQIEAGLRHL